MIVSDPFEFLFNSLPYNFSTYDIVFDDLSNSETYEALAFIKKRKKITTNDVINMYKFLRDFNGDFIDYFIRRQDA